MKKNMARVNRDFFTNSASVAAKDILGKYIVVGDKRGIVIETEAYVGPQDKASHAFGGKVTERNKAEYLTGGYVYIYLVYGMYWQLNISTGKEGYPECFLIRAADCSDDIKKTNGPGKLCKYLGLDKSFYGEDVVKSRRIWFEDGEDIPFDVVSAPRIGIDYAGPYWAKRKLRFLIKDYKKHLAKI